MNIQHKSLAIGRWQELSLPEQFGNIGSEIYRALKWKNRNKRLFNHAIERSLELLDFTIADSRWALAHRLKEICRVRELLCDAVFGFSTNKTSLQDLDHYFFSFAILARRKEGK